jgi:hypothetical protein
MKHLIFLSLIFISTVSFGQKDTVVVHDTVKTTGKEVVDLLRNGGGQIYSDAKTVISELASALKVGAEHVYTVLVKQQIVNSITNLILYFILFLSLRFSYIKLRKGVNEIDEANKNIKSRYDVINYSEDSRTIVPFLALLCLCIIAAFSLGGVNKTVTGFVNPEYGALKHIIDLINDNR